MNNQQKLTNPFYVLLSLPSTAMGFALCVQISALSWILSTKYNLSIEHVGYVWLAGPLAGLLAQHGIDTADLWSAGQGGHDYTDNMREGGAAREPGRVGGVRRVRGA